MYLTGQEVKIQGYKSSGVARPETAAGPFVLLLPAQLGDSVNPIFLSMVTLFAQAGDGGNAAAGPNFLFQIMPFVAIGLLFYFLLIRPQKHEQSRRLSMLAAVKKNDRVLTSGGIYGVVTNVHREADEVTVKVDETTNTKLRMTLSSIAQILGDETLENTDSK